MYPFYKEDKKITIHYQELKSQLPVKVVNQEF